MINKYPSPIVDSQDVIIHMQRSIQNQLIIVGKTIVNNNLVKIIKKIFIRNNKIVNVQKNPLWDLLDTSNSIWADSLEEAFKIGVKLIKDLINSTWSEKNIIIYEKDQTDNFYVSKYNSKNFTGTSVNKNKFKILSYIK